MTDKPLKLSEVDKDGETPKDGETSSPHGSMTDKPPQLSEVGKDGETPKDGETSSPHGSMTDKPPQLSEVEKNGGTPGNGETSSPHGVADKPSKLPEFQLEGERRDEGHLRRCKNKLPGVAPLEAEEAQKPNRDKNREEVDVPSQATSPDVRRSARIRQPSEMLMESQQQRHVAESAELKGRIAMRWSIHLSAYRPI